MFKNKLIKTRIYDNEGGKLLVDAIECDKYFFLALVMQLYRVLWMDSIHVAKLTTNSRDKYGWMMILEYTIKCSNSISLWERKSC